jgi:serine/threonine protein kinase
VTERSSKTDSEPPLAGMQSGVTRMKWHARRSGARLGRYRLGARLGVGGAASVYLARLEGPHDFERVLAIKIIHEHLTEEPEFVSMFLDEANLAVRLQHPNIVHVYELGHETDALFMAMEYLHGQPLSSVLRALSQAGRRLPFDVIAWVGAQAADGLHHAHELTDDQGARISVVHRDVSPDNIFVTYDGHIKLIDFGIARAKGRATSTELGKIKGKYCYMAPEQALGRDFDHRVDVFALGNTLYEAALGEPLFGGVDEAEILQNLLAGPVPDPRMHIPGFPEELVPVLLRALEMDPESRYSDIGEMGKELEAYAAQQGGGQRDRLAALMKDLFEQQRAAESQAIAELKNLPSEPPPQPRRRRWIWVTPLLVAIGGASAAALWWRGAPQSVAPQPVPSVAPAPSSVVIDVRTQPATEAVIEIGGRVVRERPARVAVPRGGTAVSVVVTATGYETAQLEAVPDRDQFLVVPLIKVAAAPSTVPVASAAPRPSSAAVPEKKKPGSHPGLVTDYPF